MAPSSGHLLVPKVMNAFRYAVSRTAQAVRARLAQAQQGAAGSQPVAIPVRAARQPLHPLAALRQSRNQTRSFTTSIRRAIAETYPSFSRRTGAPVSRVSFPVSRTSTIIARTPGAATFASTLRPNLTGGTLARTAGGYGNVAGKRMFSSLPGSQAQVVHNVSAGMRAFWVGGQRGQFNGLDNMTGEKRFVAVGTKQKSTAQKVMAARVGSDVRGTTLEFCVAPSLSAFSKSQVNTNAVGLEDAIVPLAGDFARSLGALAAVHRELKKLSSLGNLPVTESRPGWLAVRFPGCDGRAVEGLCDELGIYRGIVREDAAWAEEQAQDVKMALLFPPAPSAADDFEAEACFYPPQSPSPLRDESLPDPSYTADETLSPLESLHDSVNASHSFEQLSAPRSMVSWQPDAWENGPEPESELGWDRDEIVHDAGGSPKPRSAPKDAVQDMESIYRFLAECDGRLR